MKTKALLALTVALSGAIGALCACSPKAPSDEVAASTNTYAGESPAASITSAEASALESSSALSTYVGKWTGPEGTSLTVTPKGADYDVVVVNLDGPRTFTGKADGDGITFSRDGQAFTLRKGTGEDTGMKWLAGKHDCVVVATGEGYCHD